MQKIEFINSLGLAITIDETENYMLQNLQISQVDSINQNEQSFNQDGTSYLGSALQMRDISFSVNIYGNSIEEIYQKRRNLIKIFNPKLGEGTLKYTNDFISKSIKCVSDFVPNFPSGQGNQTQQYQIAVCSFTCNDPYFVDNDDTTVKLFDFLESFTFPFTLPMQFSIRGDSITLDNQGDIEIPVLVEFRGPVTNPKISNDTTGEFIKVNKVINIGEKLIINTEFGNKTVTFIDVAGQESNAYAFIDINSIFWDLKLGENVVSFITEGGNPEVFVTYRNKFAGV